MSRVSMEAETQGMAWSDELGRWFEKGFLLVNDGNSEVEILAHTSYMLQVRILRTDAVLWVENWKVEKSK